MLHERADGEPEAVEERELVLHLVRVRVARVRVVPLVRTEARDDEQHEAYCDVRRDHVHPDLERQRGEEGEEARVLLLRLLEEDADAEVHEGLGEVDDLFPHVANGE